MDLLRITDPAFGRDITTVCDAAARVAAFQAVGQAVRPRDVRSLPRALRSLGPLFTGMQGLIAALEADRAVQAARLRMAWRLQWIAAALGLIAGLTLGVLA